MKTATTPCVLILIDGLRPEAVAAAPMPTLLSLEGRATVEGSGAFAGTAQSVMPNCTLPCHFSIFHSVLPERHGITSNTWTPPVRPLRGLFEVLHHGGKRVAFSYNWEELRDLGRPGSVDVAFFTRCAFDGSSDEAVARHAVEFLHGGADFVFCYLGETDEVGHRHGWMSPDYLRAAARADDDIAQVLAALPADGSAVILADHGGHGRSHGTDCPEDMTVPLFIRAPQHDLVAVAAPDLLDIAPTVAALCGVTIPADWEGRALVR